MRRLSLSALLAPLSTIALAGAIACGGSSYNATGPNPSPTPTPSGNGMTVQATPSLAFSPASLTIQSGATVTFAFGSVAHNVYFDPQSGTPADITGDNANVNVTRTFSTAGTYHYTCHIHPFMHGTVVVK